MLTRISLRFAGAIAVLVTWHAADQARAQDAEVNIFVDRAQNEDFIANLEAEGFVYETEGNTVQLASPEIMSVWKGDGAVQRYVSGAFMGLFEDKAQFAPVFLVVDVTNQSGKAMQIVGAHLDVAESFTDLEPLLEIFSTYNPDCEEAKLDPAFQFANSGWGPVENAKITYTFGTESGPSGDTYAIDAGSFDQSKEVSLLEGLVAAGVNVDKVKQGDFPCPSLDDIPTCAQEVMASGVLGGLSNAVYVSGIDLLTRVSGTIEYAWTDSHGGSNRRSSPLVLDVPILHFTTEGGGPECGAGGPVERDFKTVQLLLDKSSYRIALPYKGKLAPQQNKRFALSLVASKSSQHSFKVVLDLADGTTIASPDITLLYFLPRLNVTN
jgi:hypothetical protein